MLKKLNEIAAKLEAANQSDDLDVLARTIRECKEELESITSMDSLPVVVGGNPVDGISLFFDTEDEERYSQILGEWWFSFVEEL